MKKLLNKIKHHLIKDLVSKQNDTLMLIGKLYSERVKQIRSIKSFEDVEFKVFSQWGEDGIIQFLINKIEIPNKIFVEFGVGNYQEANTRFLLMNNNWKGLIIDCSKDNINHVTNDSIYWKYDLTAISEFIKKENINDIIQANQVEGDIGLLSIDIDGNDYWVWEKIDVVKPRIVICEYNSIFGSEHPITIPYIENFHLNKTRSSNLYFGASLKALCSLAERKNYHFVGSDSVGNSAFFVRKDLSKPFKAFTAEEGFVESKFKESRDQHGRLNYISGEKRILEILDEKVYHLEKNKEIKIKELFN